MSCGDGCYLDIVSDRKILLLRTIEKSWGKYKEIIIFHDDMRTVRLSL